MLDYGSASSSNNIRNINRNGYELQIQILSQWRMDLW